MLPVDWSTVPNSLSTILCYQLLPNLAYPCQKLSNPKLHQRCLKAGRANLSNSLSGQIQYGSNCFCQYSVFSQIPLVYIHVECEAAGYAHRLFHVIIHMYRLQSQNLGYAGQDWRLWVFRNIRIPLCENSRAMTGQPFPDEIWTFRKIFWPFLSV